MGSGQVARPRRRRAAAAPDRLPRAQPVADHARDHPTVNPGWLLYLRPAANLPGPAHVAGTEGLVDGEAYRFGPLFANMRLTATGRPITFLADRPLVQLTPIPRWLVADELMQGTTGKPLPVTDMAEWAAPEWDAYHQTIVDPNLRPARKHGEYAVRARKAAAGACPYSG